MMTKIYYTETGTVVKIAKSNFHIVSETTIEVQRKEKFNYILIELIVLCASPLKIELLPLVPIIRCSQHFHTYNKTCWNHLLG